MFPQGFSVTAELGVQDNVIDYIKVQVDKEIPIAPVESPIGPLEVYFVSGSLSVDHFRGLRPGAHGIWWGRRVSRGTEGGCDIQLPGSHSGWFELHGLALDLQCRSEN